MMIEINSSLRLLKKNCAYNIKVKVSVWVYILHELVFDRVLRKFVKE